MKIYKIKYIIFKMIILIYKLKIENLFNKIGNSMKVFSFKNKLIWPTKYKSKKYNLIKIFYPKKKILTFKDSKLS